MDPHDDNNNLDGLVCEDRGLRELDKSDIQW
jgi:hypothetical protein